MQYSIYVVNPLNERCGSFKEHSTLCPARVVINWSLVAGQGRRGCKIEFHPLLNQKSYRPPPVSATANHPKIAIKKRTIHAGSAPRPRPGLSCIARAMSNPGTARYARLRGCISGNEGGAGI